MSEQKPQYIGQFESVENNKPRTLVGTPFSGTPVAVPPATPTAPKQEEKSTETAEEDAASKLLKAPTKEELAEQYAAGLAAVGLTLEDARYIMDEVLFKEMYTETFEIGRGVTATFRTRTYTDTQRILRIIEAEAPRIPMHYNDILARCNLAASLVTYNGRSFPKPVQTEKMSTDAFRELEETAFHTCLTYVIQLPTPVTTRLMHLLSKFDAKLYAVFADGAPADF